ncbi:MAG: ribonuclease P protein component [Proteobacteria bacterium]|jgi:ribonuclease P protein component|nr:ribonuclease P protein component [Pseudomonadota bacterium]MBT5065491.1 ribonuclease P protein component [Pseudomonadota bacterium]MBT6193415.1 ribonuclease P protein component [Pseudomonadota bacterium]MBT6464848.1 ribonuclease P protein component [Pseudomonadota bacterium]MBT6674176.1 ribonuclease P protein component [Pseudomonadota bacterium]
MKMTSGNDFKRILRKGQCQKTEAFNLYYYANGLGHPRLGLSVSKRVSNKATVRNKIKRAIREVFRCNATLLSPADYFFNVKPNSKMKSLGAVKSAVSCSLDEKKISNIAMNNQGKD